MKKKLSVVVVALMVLAMSSVSVMAAVSPAAKSADVLAEAAASDQGDVEALDQEVVAKVNGVVAQTAEAVQNMVSQNYSADQGAAILGSLGINTGFSAVFGDQKTVSLSDFTSVASAAEEETVSVVTEVKAAFDFTPSDDIAEELAMNGSVEVTFEVEDVEEDDNVLLLHEAQTDDWEVILPEEVGEGYVTAEFSGFSPIAIVKVTVEDTAASEGAVGTAVVAQVDDTVAPKTGEPFAWIALVAVVAFAGVVVCAKKYSYNK